MTIQLHQFPSRLRCSILACALLAGCALDTDEPEPELSAKTSDISLVPGTPWSAGTDLDLGPTATQTCFLSGVSGEFLGKLDKFNEITSKAIASVRPRNGSWWLHVDGGSGTGVKGRAVCVKVPFKPAMTITWSDNIPAGSFVPVAPHRHCYLSEIWATYGLDGTTAPFIGSTTKTGIRITNDGTNFTLDDSWVDLAGYGRNGGGGSAVCFDYDGVLAFAEPVSAPPLFTETSTIETGAGTKFSVSNSSCGFTDLTGNWMPTISLGLEDGVVMDYDAADTSFWKVTVTNGHSGRVSCLH